MMCYRVVSFRLGHTILCLDMRVSRCFGFDHPASRSTMTSEVRVKLYWMSMSNIVGYDFINQLSIKCLEILT
jgi:hypothetical protein